FGGITELVMKNALMSLSQNSEFEIEQMEVDQDHLPILMTISPRYSVSQYVRRIKQHTTRVVWQLHPKLKRQFWKEKTFWSDGYFACSVGNASAETVRKYIQDQG
ncbi:IS200/IS605 family transposase, partial [Vibrio breoganii]